MHADEDPVAVLEPLRGHQQLAIDLYGEFIFVLLVRVNECETRLGVVGQLAVPARDADTTDD